jgi:hypothetical protein
MAISNTGHDHGEHIEQLRGAIEHRATWMYLLMKEARERGLEWDDFARKAIRTCGHFHGETKFPVTENVREFGASFATDVLRKVFEMDVLELTDERLVVEFNYCPLVSGWQKQDAGEADIEALCDVAMEGDRGIIDKFPAFSFDLQTTIAAGDRVCRLVIAKE